MFLSLPHVSRHHLGRSHGFLRSVMVPLSRVPVVVASTPLVDVEALLFAGGEEKGPSLLPVLDESNGQPVSALILARLRLLMTLNLLRLRHHVCADESYNCACHSLLGGYFGSQ